MRKLFCTMTAVSVLALTTASCSDDNGAGPTSGDPLSEAEATEVLNEVLGVMSQAFADVANAPQAAPAATHTIDETINESANCAGGGSVGITGSVNGSFDDQTFALDLEFDFTETISNCQTTATGGPSFTVNGNPNIEMQGDYAFSGSSLTGSFSMSGGFRYESSDGRSGECGIEVDVDYSTQQGSGSVCGISYSEALNLMGGS